MGYRGQYINNTAIIERQARFPKPLLSLDEKARLCKELGVTYTEVQKLLENCKSREDVDKKVKEKKREKFLREAQRNADEATVYMSTIGCYGGNNAEYSERMHHLREADRVRTQGYQARMSDVQGA